MLLPMHTGKEECSFFQWAEFDDNNGNPVWNHQQIKDGAAPNVAKFSASQLIIANFTSNFFSYLSTFPPFCIVDLQC